MNRTYNLDILKLSNGVVFIFIQRK